MSSLFLCLMKMSSVCVWHGGGKSRRLGFVRECFGKGGIMILNASSLFHCCSSGRVTEPILNSPFLEI